MLDAVFDISIQEINVVYCLPLTDTDIVCIHVNQITTLEVSCITTN